DAETGERGYLITGEEPFLEPYQAAIAQINGNVDRLRRLTADNPSQQARIPTLERKIADRLDNLKMQIDRRKSGDAKGVRQIVLSGVGRRQMDDLRQYIAGMQREENGLLRRESDETRASGRYAFLTDVIVNLIACALLSSIAYIVIR